MPVFTFDTYAYPPYAPNAERGIDAPTTGMIFGVNI
jgi:hypothetical protein